MYDLPYLKRDECNGVGGGGVKADDFDMVFFMLNMLIPL